MIRGVSYLRSNSTLLQNRLCFAQDRKIAQAHPVLKHAQHHQHHGFPRPSLPTCPSARRFTSPSLSMRIYAVAGAAPRRTNVLPLRLALGSVPRRGDKDVTSRFASSPSRRSARTTRRRSKSTAVPSAAAASRSSSAGGARAGAGGAGTSGSSGAGRSFSERLTAFFLKPRVIPFPRWITPRHFTITLSEVCGHLSFILVFCSYAVDDFLLLRIIAVAGSTSILFFAYFHPYGRVLWLPLKWNCLFIAVNLYRIGKVLYQEYQATKLSEEMLAMHHDHFHVIELVDFAKLVNAGETEVFEPGDVVLQQGEWNKYLRLVLDGELDVFRDGHVTYTLEEGNFISEMGLHAGLKLTGPVESSAAVVAKRDSPPVHCLRWDRTELIALLDRNPSLRRSFQSALSWDVVSKLKGQRQLLLRHNTRPDEVIEYRKNQSEFRYLAILHNVLARDDVDKYKEEINMYRMIHHINEDQHREALKKCGWTPEEFESGKNKKVPRRLSKKLSVSRKKVVDAALES